VCLISEPDVEEDTVTRFRILPKYKIRTEGEKVRILDQIKLVPEGEESRFLHVAKVGSGKLRSISR
jgi:hypothetical protein